MAKCPSTKEIQDYLEKNGFYSYLDFEQVARNYSEDLKMAISPANKKSICLPKKWSDIKGFGPPRRLLILELQGESLTLYDTEVIHEGKAEVMHDQKVNFYRNEAISPQQLHQDIKKQLDAFVPDEEKSEITDTIFVFAYALEQFIRDDGCVDGVGEDLSKMSQFKSFADNKIGLGLQNYLRENGYPKIRISLINDTIASLLYIKAHEIVHGTQFDAAINILVDEGTNLSLRYDSPIDGKCYLINTEFGDFHGPKMSKFDLKLEQEFNVGRDYHNEKMISGHWQHFLMKTIMHDMTQQQMIPSDIFGKLNIQEMGSSELERTINTSILDPEYHEALNFIWKEIVRRGSSLCGMALARIVNKIYQHHDMEEMNIALNEIGAVLDRTAGFRGNMYKTLNNELLDLDIREHVVIHPLSPRFHFVEGAVLFDAIFNR